MKQRGEWPKSARRPNRKHLETRQNPRSKLWPRSRRWRTLVGLKRQKLKSKRRFKSS